jgi:ABC-type dipeptide/oligopeptide/nickel transport systems, permease components
MNLGWFMMRRLFQALLTLLGVVTLVFILFNWVGGDPATVLAGKMASAEDIANVRHQLGLDRPWWEQYGCFWGRWCVETTGPAGQPMNRFPLSF